MGKKKGWEIWEFRTTPFGNIQLMVSNLTEPANVIWNLHHHSSFLLTIKNIPNHQSGTNQNMNMVGARIIERKLRSTKLRLFTVPCCSIIRFSSEGMKKKRILTYSYFFSSFDNSGLFYNCVFPHFPTFTSFVL